jgi:hypothetical protein
MVVDNWRRVAMSQNEDCRELRQEILRLLQAQMHALAEPSRLSDVELAACYRRQERAGELRDQLFIALKPKEALEPECGDLSSAPIPSATSGGPAIQAAVGM